MANLLAHYSPEDVSVTFGTFDISGFVEKEFIVVRREELVYKARPSADGKVTRSAIGNRLYEVRLYLQSSSESNLTLNLIRDIDRSTHMGRLPLLIKDNLGSTMFFSGSAWIEGEPTVGLGVEVSEREWIFRCTESSLVVGGNYEISNGSEDMFRGLRGGLPELRNFLR